MNPIIPVMTGGAIGAALRYLAGLALAARGENDWPWGTFAVNIAGGFAMGLLAASVLKGSASDGMRLFVGVGVLGGFTTFSAFSLESFNMIQRGDLGLALGYVVASVVGSTAALAAGFALVRG
jgi:fluoride exporter